MGYAPSVAWHVYLVRCGDGTLYAGATTDLSRRFAAHASGKGARYTRGRGPLVLAWSEEVPDRSAALRREHEIKRLQRAQKLRLVRR
jgi:predicted GIY-YIG superfamily endonuclease